MFKKIFWGIIIGFINGMFGAGGGMVAVPLLKKLGFKQKDAHRCSIALILPLSIITLGMYLYFGRVKLSSGVPYILPGLIGAAIGTAILSAISENKLGKIFGALMLFAGIRLVLK